MSKPLIIGLVGGIGAGKSAVAELFVQRGARLIAADPLGHEALRQPDIRARLVDFLGTGVLDAQGEIDRRRLGSIVFGDAERRRWLESLVHPYIGQRIEEEIARAERTGVQLVVLDAAVMFEAGWNTACDRIVYVEAPQEVRQARVEKTRGWSADDWLRRESAQLPLTHKRSHADHVIDNSTTLEHLSRQVDDLLHQWGIVPATCHAGSAALNRPELSRP